MIRQDLPAQLLPWPRPLVADLRRAPELAVLAVLHTALHAAVVALAAEHSTLDDFGSLRDPPTLRHARAVVEACLVLGAALDGYRRAAIAAFQVSLHGDHDLPF